MCWKKVPADDWFNSEVIRNLALACVVSGSVFFWRMFTRPNPLVDFHAFKNRNFTAGCIFSFTMGIGLYGLTYLYPVYLARIQNYSAMMIGETMFVTGVAMFLTAPIAGRLSTKVDPRIMIGGGFVGFALGTWQAHYITSDWAFWELLVPANPARRVPDDVHGDGHQHRTRRACAHAIAWRIWPVQSHPQSRWCRWPCPHQHHHEPAL